MCGSEKTKEVEMGAAGTCKVGGCNKNKVADGMCYKHYKKEHGEPYKPKTHRGEKKEKEKIEDKPDEKPKATVDNVFPHLPSDLPGDLPVYKKTAIASHLVSLIANMEKQLEALRIVLGVVRKAA
jgi:hypothetical protein